jgi:hypothetical protein
MRAVSALSCLKIFHFPRRSAALAKLRDRDNGEVEYIRRWPEGQKIPRWSDSLETFHMPSLLDPGYILAFENTPASLKSLVVEDSGGVTVYVVDTIFGLIGSQILTLKVEYDDDRQDQLADIFRDFPNLLHLSLLPELIDFYVPADLELEHEHPLRTLTINLEEMDDILDTDFLMQLEDLVFHQDLLPNIRCLTLFHEFSADHWECFLREYPLPLAVKSQSIELLNIGKYLKQQSSSASVPKESGLWLVNGDGTVCEFTEELVAKITCGMIIPEEIEGNGCEGNHKPDNNFSTVGSQSGSPS